MFETIWFAVSVVLIAVLITFMFVGYKAKRGPTDYDPCGNNNIKPRKPQDYL